MRKNQIFILVTSVTLILFLLIAAVYFLINSNTNGTSSMMGSVPTTNNWVISLVFIAIAIIVSIIIVVYFVYSKNEKSERTKIETLSNINSAKTKESLSTGYEKLGVRDGGSKPFDVFLCYKKSSGKDYADHLKTGLEELGLHTFQDCKDIPLTVGTQEGWAMVRDKALEESKYFVLIMTPGFNLSSEVVKAVSYTHLTLPTIYSV